jgi:hypothetical protein
MLDPLTTQRIPRLRRARARGTSVAMKENTSFSLGLFGARATRQDGILPVARALYCLQHEVAP